ncbi:hypothetical protein TNCV_3409041 [Trichonephila clavipes]|nr:hypothetical protein TNCV_3409041 [Trichonephila clavipes]
MWLMHDGVPPHFFIVMLFYYHTIHSRRWIGRGRPILRPPHSPDLNPLDFSKPTEITCVDAGGYSGKSIGMDLHRFC